MKKIIKRELKTLFGGIILAGAFLGAVKLLGIVLEWLMADMGRYWLGIGILVYIVYRFLKSELGE